MWAALVLSGVVMAAPAPSVVLLPLHRGEDVPEDVAELLSDAILSGVRKQQVFSKVVSFRDVEQALQVEQQKAMLGCADESCFAQIAASLGADLALSGKVAVVAGLWNLSLKLTDAHDGHVAAAVLHHVRSKDGSELLLAVDSVVQELLHELDGPPPSAPLTPLWWVMGVPAAFTAVVALLLSIPSVVALGAALSAPGEVQPLTVVGFLGGALGGLVVAALAALSLTGWVALGAGLAFSRSIPRKTALYALTGTLAALNGLASVLVAGLLVTAVGALPVGMALTGVGRSFGIFVWLVLPVPALMGLVATGAGWAVLGGLLTWSWLLAEDEPTM